MKTTILPLTTACVIWAALGGAEPVEPPAMRDVATHDDLVLALRESERTDPMKKLAVAKGKDPSVLNRPKDLISQSDLISFGGLVTLVPKHAILQIPENCKARLKPEPGARLVVWSEFIAANHGWITTLEISREQAEGRKPIAEETRKQMSKSRNLIVATYQGGPISMLQPKLSNEPTIQPP